jgi:dihydroorotase
MEPWEAQRVAAWDSNERPFILAGVEVLDPQSGTTEPRDLLVRDSRVHFTTRGDRPEGVLIFELPGRIAAPGFVDIHVHLREPGFEDSETIASGAAAAARGGFVAVASMANTRPPIDDPQSVRFVLERAREAGMARVFPIAAVSRNLEGKELTEMFDLASAGAVAFSDDGMTIMDANLMRRALEYAGMLDKPIVTHAEDMNLKRDGLAHEGYMATKLGLRPIPRATEEVIVARDIRLVEHTGGRMHVAHVSCASSVEMIRDARARGLRVSGEVTPHHLVFTDERLAGYDPNFKMAPPLREEEDRAALVEALKDGTLAAVATDHAPHHEIAKDVTFDDAPNGVIGTETAFAALHTRLVMTGEIDLPTLVRAMSVGPASVLDLEHGVIRDGGPADLTLLDLEATWTVSKADFVSRSKNCPWIGETLTGLPVAAVSAGRMIYHHPSVTPQGSPEAMARS